VLRMCLRVPWIHRLGMVLRICVCVFRWVNGIDSGLSWLKKKKSTCVLGWMNETETGLS
jgi:hypothetical protein